MLIALEGLDGSGKTTVQRRVARRLRAHGYAVHATQEPTRTPLGRRVRAAIRSRREPAALLLLFLQDRARHVGRLRRLPDRTLILTDRYVHSTTAYQAAALSDRWPRPLQTLHELQAALFPAPDLAFFLDVPPKVGLQRIQKRSVKEPFETLRFLEAVRRNYLTLVRRGALVRIDAARAADRVADEITQRILEARPGAAQR